MSSSSHSPVTPSRGSRYSPRRSPFFDQSPTKATSLKRKPRTPSTASPTTLPLPPLTAKSFGLIQEVLADKPFQLLVAVTFLNQTRASEALPVLFKFLARYPSPEALAAADAAQVTQIIAKLGLQIRRTETLTKLAVAWVNDGRPIKGKRYRTLHYPCLGDGKDIVPGEILADNEYDGREGAWEVGGLPGVGAYALDSWRIFCRDALRGISSFSDVEPEWKRVLPKDKELRAFLRWRWLKVGWLWDPQTGVKRAASSQVLVKAIDRISSWDELDIALQYEEKTYATYENDMNKM